MAEEGAAPAATGTPAANPPAGDDFDNIETPPGSSEAAPAPELNEDGSPKEGQTPPATPPKLWAGRYKTPEEMESGLYESGREGRRLSDLTKTLSKERGEFETKFKDAELRIKHLSAQGAAKELSAEELTKLREENPGAYTDYILDKQKRESAIQAEKDKVEQDRVKTEGENTRIDDMIQTQHLQMKSDAAKYPGYMELTPVMDSLLDIAPELAGHDWTPKILYFASKGLQALRGERKAAALTQEEKDKAASEAAVRGDTTGTPGRTGQPSTAGGTGLDKLNQEIISEQPKRILPSFQ